jgi:hypothetical protein
MPNKNTYVPQCELCGEVQNDAHVLTDMWKKGSHAPLRICSKQRCWDKAHADGYKSSYERTADTAT